MTKEEMIEKYWEIKEKFFKVWTKEERIEDYIDTFGKESYDELLADNWWNDDDFYELSATADACSDIREMLTTDEEWDEWDKALDYLEMCGEDRCDYGLI